MISNLNMSSASTKKLSEKYNQKIESVDEKLENDQMDEAPLPDGQSKLF